ncbi:MAG: N-carbamoylputrescine amidase [Sporolactobacillus sp.]|nr:N-carbamoylputrescine amidase [Sporolactobacillus sp.]
MRNVVVAVVQMRCTAVAEQNIEKAEKFVRDAAMRGAQIVLLQELFSTRYFCQTEKAAYYALAEEAASSRTIDHFRRLARELGVVLPISFYERRHNALYNSLAMIDADGTVLGIYRKSHIPAGPGYEEKFYFIPGDTGFRVWETAYGKLGAGICWDQWFPEAARCMALMGAELLLYPTAIGSEPDDASIDSKDHWQACMLGHAAANLVPVIAANRVGTETEDDSSITFYGSSFIAGPDGKKLAEAGRSEETVLTAAFNLDELAARRLEWGVFRDRRPELYRLLTTYDGELRR